ncbi:MAG: hypothetical protein IJO20_07620 [Ruminococcus sp.]|nr:hypothetical protein [Ruminococcus sp.]
MKRVCVASLVVLIVLLSIVVTHAENTVNVSAFADSALENRLFEISIVAQPQGDICAGEITICYDSDIVEFREVKSDGYFVEAKDSTGEVKIVFGGAYCEKTENGELLSVKFKAVSEGSFDLGLSCCSFVNEDLSPVSVNAYDTQITVNKNSVKSKSVKKTQKTERIENTAEGTEGNSESSADELFINHDNENKNSVLFIVCICAAVVVAFLLGMLFSRKSVVAEDDDELDDY